jgi:hypothetical protein
MKSFKEYTDRNKKVSWLDIPNFDELRNKVKNKKISWLDIPNFDELRNKVRQNDIKENNNINWRSQFKFDFDHKPGKNKNVFDSKYDDIHDHPDIKPKDDSPINDINITHYCNTFHSEPNGYRSSVNINEHLRHLAGQPVRNPDTQGIYPTGTDHQHSPEKVKQAIKDLSATFNDNTTNRMSLKTYSGVPEHIGEHLEQSGTDVKHHIPGFLSTSTHLRTASNFSVAYPRKKYDDPYHVLQIHVHPGVGRSVAHNSQYDENEVLLHHGTEMTYSHTTDGVDHRGMKFKMHHVIAHPTRIKLEDYGKV